MIWVGVLHNCTELRMPECLFKNAAEMKKNLKAFSPDQLMIGRGRNTEKASPASLRGENNLIGAGDEKSDAIDNSDGFFEEDGVDIRFEIVDNGIGARDEKSDGFFEEDGVDIRFEIVDNGIGARDEKSDAIDNSDVGGAGASESGVIVLDGPMDWLSGPEQETNGVWTTEVPDYYPKVQLLPTGN